MTPFVLVQLPRTEPSITTESRTSISNPDPLHPHDANRNLLYPLVRIDSIKYGAHSRVCPVSPRRATL
jgi:hypothetical protein